MAVTEVKNVKYQGWTLQLKDDLYYATQHGLDFDLFVRPGCRLSKPLMNALKTHYNFYVYPIP